MRPYLAGLRQRNRAIIVDGPGNVYGHPFLASPEGMDLKKKRYPPTQTGEWEKAGFRLQTEPGA